MPWIFFMNFYFKIGVEMKLRIITKNYAADPKIGFPTKSISKTMPTAWELNKLL